MLYLITGRPGHGKTLFAVSRIHELLEKNKLPEESPRKIYSDIAKLSFPEVDQSPFDWTETPDGSIVFYDECQKRFGPDQAGRASDPVIQAMETHRHSGHDIYLITQHPKLLHSHIRRLVGRHYHVVRKFGSETAVIYQKDGTIDVDKEWKLSENDHFPWEYPSELFNKYKSATMHTVKREMPKWLKRSILYCSIGLLVVVPSLGYTAYKIFGTADETIEKHISQPLTPPTHLSTIDIVASPVVVGCISSDYDCICYDEQYRPINYDFATCKNLMEQPLRTIPLISKN